MTILVTGGAGFIGSHLCERLLVEGQRVRVIDNLSSGKRANLPRHAGLELVVGDICDAALVDGAMEGVEAVYHLAAVASVKASIDDPLGTHASNLIGTVQLLEAAGRHGARRVVYASSAAVYGDCRELPIREASPLSPLSPYAIDKLAGEHYLRYYAGRFGFAAVALRFFNIYGPRQDPSSPYSGVISVFCDRLASQRGIDVFGDGLQTRDFVYVGDLVEVLWRALELPLSEVETVNVGSGRATSLLDLIAALEGFAGRTLERRHHEAREGDIRHSLADVTRLQALFGYVPTRPFEEGLRDILEHQVAATRP
jgi:UDP-glucose 4-epimerase